MFDLLCVSKKNVILCYLLQLGQFKWCVLFEHVFSVKTLFLLLIMYYLIVLTSSNFLVIRENALKIAFVEPETVTMRSGHDPSDILIVAPD